MSYYKTCPTCGAHLDPGEACDCQAKKEAPADVCGTGRSTQTQNDNQSN